MTDAPGSDAARRVDIRSQGESGLRSLLALVGLAISFALPTFGQQQKSLKELIVGTWLLVSVYDQTQDGVNDSIGTIGGLIFLSRIPMALEVNDMIGGHDV
jgi:hypothetical protein